MFIFALNESDLLGGLLFPILVNIITLLLTELILKPVCEKILIFYKDLKKMIFSIDFLFNFIYDIFCFYALVLSS